MPRKRAQPAPARSSSATTLRICGLDNTYGDCAPTVEPEVARFQVAGSPCDLLAWTAAEWERLSGDERPGDAFRGSRGSWFRFEPPVD